jgi:hypothetical protein
MGLEAKAADDKAPFGDGTNPTSVLFFTCDSTSRANALPGSLQGEFVWIINTSPTNGAFWFVSSSDSAQCDETVAATDGGTSSPQLGEWLAPGASVRRRLPYWRPDEVRYFVRASAASAPLMVVEANS